MFLMGVSALPEICQGLLSGGLGENTPAALVSLGTTAMQKEVFGTLKTLPEKVKTEGAKLRQWLWQGRCAPVWRS